MSFGPNPWQQTSWDARAAGNFIGGGAGCGLLLFTWLAQAQGSLRMVLVGLALALVSLGLVCVWAEIGRPWRAINVIFNPRTSWMSREAALAPLLLGSGGLALLGVAAALPLAALLALAFVYCQARILQAAQGHPGLARAADRAAAGGHRPGRGCRPVLAVRALVGPGRQCAVAGLRRGAGVALRARSVVVPALGRGACAARALRAVNQAGHAFNAGSLLPLAIVLGVWATPLPPGWSVALQALAGALAALGGAGFKFMLVTRAGYNQGFALPHLPVRGVRR